MSKSLILLTYFFKNVSLFACFIDLCVLPYMYNNKQKDYYNMNTNKDFDNMRNQVKKKLDDVLNLIQTFDEKNNQNLSEDMNYKVEAIVDSLDDNYEINN